MNTPQGKVPGVQQVSNQSVPRYTQRGRGGTQSPRGMLEEESEDPRKAERLECTRRGVDLSACPRRHFLPARTLSDRIYSRTSIGLTGQQWQLSIQHCQLLILEAGGEYLCKECPHQPVSRVKPFCIRQKSLHVYKGTLQPSNLPPKNFSKLGHCKL